MQEQTDATIENYLNGASGQELKEMINKQYGTLHNFIYIDEIEGCNNKKDIMDSITKETGLKTKGGGIVFSLPISKAIGLYE